MTPIFYTIVEENGAFQVKNGIGNAFDLEAVKDLPGAVDLLKSEFHAAQGLELEDLEKATALQIELTQHSVIRIEYGNTGNRKQEDVFAPETPKLAA